MPKTKSASDQDRAKALISSFHGAPDDLVFWSFRYFLGRRTIHTCCFAADLAKAWPHLDKRVADMIKGELEEQFRKDDRMRADRNCSPSYYPLGDICDRDAWWLVLEAANSNLVPHPKRKRTTAVKAKCTCQPCPPGSDDMFWRQDQEVACERRAAQRSNGRPVNVDHH